jgi:cytochrome c-type biogenesis protein CcmE
MNEQNDPILAADAAADTTPAAASTTLFGPRVKLAVVLLVPALALAYWGLMTFSNATVFYVSVAELRAGGPTEEGKLVRVSGKLVPETFARSPSGVDASFQLQDAAGDVLEVSYLKGEVGQIFFNPHSTIDLEGRYSADGVFVTDTLVVKCPSKYVTEQERAELAGEEPGTPYEVVITGA